MTRYYSDESITDRLMNVRAMPINDTALDTKVDKIVDTLMVYISTHRLSVGDRIKIIDKIYKLETLVVSAMI